VSKIDAWHQFNECQSPLGFGILDASVWGCKNILFIGSILQPLTPQTTPSPTAQQTTKQNGKRNKTE